MNWSIGSITERPSGSIVLTPINHLASTHDTHRQTKADRLQAESSKLQQSERALAHYTLHPSIQQCGHAPSSPCWGLLPAPMPSCPLPPARRPRVGIDCLGWSGGGDMMRSTSVRCDATSYTRRTITTHHSFDPIPPPTPNTKPAAVSTPAAAQWYVSLDVLDFCSWVDRDGLWAYCTHSTHSSKHRTD